MHRKSKHIILEGKKNKRVDKLISALLELMHHYLLMRVVHIVNKINKLAAIKKGHHEVHQVK